MAGAGEPDDEVSDLEAPRLVDWEEGEGEDTEPGVLVEVCWAPLCVVVEDLFVRAIRTAIPPPGTSRDKQKRGVRTV